MPIDPPSEHPDTDILALARSAEDPDAPWAWVLQQLILHADDPEGLAEGLVSGADLDQH